jgi:sulfite exporter TauE/SafE
VPLRTQKPRSSLFATFARLVPKEPLIFGLLSVLLPCGVLASALLAAVAAGDATHGALLMSAFAAISGLAVLGASLTTKLVPRRFATPFRRTVAYALVALAALTVSRPILALSNAPHDAAAHSVHCH